MTVIETALAEHRFLEGISPEHIRLLSECARAVEFQSGQFLLRQGSEAKSFYLIRSGKVSVELFSGLGGPVVIQTLTGGDVLGWSWLIPPYHWRFDARAVEATSALMLEGELLRGILKSFPAFGYELLERFIRVIADRLEAEREKLVSLYGAHS